MEQIYTQTSLDFGVICFLSVNIESLSNSKEESMYTYGKKEIFQIQYSPYLEEFKDDPDVIENPSDYLLGGSIFFWVGGKNIFGYKDLEPDATYCFYDMFYLVEYFCEHLKYILRIDPFPVKTQSKIGVIMMDETSLVEGPDNDIKKYLYVDWDNIDMEERGKINRWSYRHGLLTHSGGSFFPDAYFQRVNDQMEISWKNDFAHDNGKMKIYSLHKEGVEYVDIEFFRDTVFAFCLEYLKRLEIRNPSKANELRDELKKVMELPLFEEANKN